MTYFVFSVRHPWLLAKRSKSSGDILMIYSPVELSFCMTFKGVLIDSTDPPLLLLERLKSKQITFYFDSQFINS